MEHTLQATTMKLIMENWKKYLEEGDVIPIQTHRKYKKHQDFSRITPAYTETLRWSAHEFLAGREVSEGDIFAYANSTEFLEQFDLQAGWLNSEDQRDRNTVDRFVKASFEMAQREKSRLKKIKGRPTILDKLGNFFKKGKK